MMDYKDRGKTARELAEERLAREKALTRKPLTQQTCDIARHMSGYYTRDVVASTLEIPVPLIDNIERCGWDVVRFNREAR